MPSPEQIIQAAKNARRPRNLDHERWARIEQLRLLAKLYGRVKPREAQE